MIHNLNQDYAETFMDSLPNPLRKATIEVFNFYNLKQMLAMRLEGPNTILVERYSLSEDEWLRIFNMSILTKLSYFNVSYGFPNRYIDRLIEISAFCLNLPKQSPQDLAKIVAHEHPAFSDWLMHIARVQQYNQRYHA